MMIYSCMYCVAPKRHPGCHGSCPEYLADKAKHDREKAEMDKQRAIINGIYEQRGEKVYKALRSRRGWCV